MSTFTASADTPRIEQRRGHASVHPWHVRLHGKHAGCGRAEEHMRAPSERSTKTSTRDQTRPARAMSVRATGTITAPHPASSAPRITAASEARVSATLQPTTCICLDGYRSTCHHGV